MFFWKFCHLEGRELCIITVSHGIQIPVKFSILLIFSMIFSHIVHFLVHVISFKLSGDWCLRNIQFRQDKSLCFKADSCLKWFQVKIMMDIACPTFLGGVERFINSLRTYQRQIPTSRHYSPHIPWQTCEAKETRISVMSQLLRVICFSPSLDE